MAETGTLDGRGGVRLFYRWNPVPDAKGLVVVVHGFGEHSGRYQHVYERLGAAGLASFGFDYRGHGNATGRRAFVESYDEYLDDVDTAMEAAAAKAPGLPRFLVGHSQGGLIGAAYALRTKGLQAVALSGPALGFKVKVPAWKAVLGQVMSRLWPTLGIPSGLDSKDLSHDHAVVTAYDEDPLVQGKATARWYTEILAAQERVMKTAAALTTPILVMHGADDAICDPAVSRRFVDSLTVADKTYTPYPGLYHEIFNETSRDAVLNDLVAWLSERLPAEAA